MVMIVLRFKASFHFFKLILKHRPGVARYKNQCVTVWGFRWVLAWRFHPHVSCLHFRSLCCVFFTTFVIASISLTCPCLALYVFSLCVPSFCQVMDFTCLTSDRFVYIFGLFVSDFDSCPSHHPLYFLITLKQQLHLVQIPNCWVQIVAKVWPNERNPTDGGWGSSVLSE